MSVDEALQACDSLGTVKRRLQIQHDLGLGYLTLGEETPGLSGGEAQRLKLASEMGRARMIRSLSLMSRPSVCIPWMYRLCCLFFRRCWTMERLLLSLNMIRVSSPMRTISRIWGRAAARKMFAAVLKAEPENLSEKMPEIFTDRKKGSYGYDQRYC
ncbi:MAG: hypothetical protein LKE64_00410 [Solobacterium sp.]|jgi:hypothetical protein|nr:hypothetical protein [Solobacterium sp.]MCH4050099.1 hypothetical protein [Solobacterium sp.]MCH4073784.1 hypothetical protein [Solobacterium sp.]MCI1314443.1 hypothetical protein [Solobacterium sp.]MCI1346640.1 hypothetical protein [Solobacterium sp.]